MTFTNIILTAAAILLVLAVASLVSLYLIPILRLIPGWGYEIIIYLVCFAAIVGGKLLTGIDEFIAFPGCLGLIGAISFSHYLHRNFFQKLMVDKKSYPYYLDSLILFIVWAIAAIVYQSSLLGFIAIIALETCLGFAVVIRPLRYTIGFTERDVIPIGIMASGDGLIIKDNQIKDKKNKQYWIDFTGKKETKGAVTLENRGINCSGWNFLIEGNNYEVYRNRIGNTNYLSVDGEGILIQECCGGTKVNGAVINNNRGNAYIGLYKVGHIRNVSIIDNQITSNIFVMADTNNKPYSMENIRFENNNVVGKITMNVGLGSWGNLIDNNIGKGQIFIEYSCGITVKNNSGFDAINCS